MTVWMDDADFMKDIESVSDFFIPGPHNNPNTKFTFKSKVQNRLVGTPWYESDSEEEIDYSFGRGKNPADSSKKPGTSDHHEVLRDIRMQVRNTVGNRYNNEVLESYYKVTNEETDSIYEDSAETPKEPNVTNDKNKNSPVDNKLNKTENNENSVANSVSDDHKNSCENSKNYSPKREINNWRKNRRNGGRNSSYRPDKVDVNSKADFPPLK